MEQLDRILDLASKIYYRYCVSLLSHGDLDQAVALLETARGIRPYAYKDTEAFKSLWETVRSSETQNALLLDTATSFHLALSENGIDVNKLINNCAAAFSIVGGKKSVVDVVLKDRAFDITKDAEILKDNFWFIYLYFLGIADVSTHIKLTKAMVNGVEKDGSGTPR
jgi:hypothetical protein